MYRGYPIWIGCTYGLSREKQSNSEQIKVYFGLYSIVVIINKAGFGIWKKCFVMLNLNH